MQRCMRQRMIGHRDRHRRRRRLCRDLEKSSVRIAGQSTGSGDMKYGSVHTVARLKRDEFMKL